MVGRLTDLIYMYIYILVNKCNTDKEVEQNGKLLIESIGIHAHVVIKIIQSLKECLLGPLIINKVIDN